MYKRQEDTVTFEFTVRDTGKGMSEAFQQRAFEPFAQEEASARSSYVGTGLGLAIVKELVEKIDVYKRQCVSSQNAFIRKLRLIVALRQAAVNDSFSHAFGVPAPSKRES